MEEIQGATLRPAEQGWADAAIRLVLVALVVYWSFVLLRPFIAILIWVRSSRLPSTPSIFG